MHPGLDQITACTAGDIQAYCGSFFELEANAFAAELLMPEFLMMRELQYRSPTVETGRRLAETFQTSFTASVLRMVQFSKLPVFVAYSVNGRMKWCQGSPSSREYFFKQAGTELDGDSLARAFLHERVSRTLRAGICRVPRVVSGRLQSAPF